MYYKKQQLQMSNQKVLGGVQEKHISNRREEWELENQLLAP